MDLSALIEHCALHVEPIAVAAIMRPESNFKPHAIGINHSSLKLAKQPESQAEAVAWSKWLITHGYNIDMGLMQINSKNLQKLGLTVESVFDPCININAGTQLLVQNYETAAGKYGHGQKAFRAAISAYNTGSFEKGFRNGYVKKVVSNMSNKVLAAIVPSKTPLFNARDPIEKTKVDAKSKEKHDNENQQIAMLNPYTADTEVESFKALNKMPIDQ